MDSATISGGQKRVNLAGDFAVYHTERNEERNAAEHRRRPGQRRPSDRRPAPRISDPQGVERVRRSGRRAPHASAVARERLPARRRRQLAVAARADAARGRADRAAARAGRRRPLAPLHPGHARGRAFATGRASRASHEGARRRRPPRHRGGRFGDLRSRAGRRCAPSPDQGASCGPRTRCYTMRGSRAVAVALLPLAVAGCAALSRTAADDGDGSRLRLVAASRDPRAEAYYDFAAAQLHVQAGRFKEAIPLLQDAIKRDPNSAFLWTQLAQWMVRADQPAEALAAAQKAVQLAPDDPGPHLTLAELLRAQKNFREAEAELEKVIELNPMNEDAYLTLARYQVEQKAYDRARAVLLRLAERQPRLAQAQFLLGRLAIETEHWDEAIARPPLAVDIGPAHDRVWKAEERR